MSRPISIDELIKQDKPRFIKKSERRPKSQADGRILLLVLLEPQVKLINKRKLATINDVDNPNDNQDVNNSTSTSISAPKSKKSKNKFNFDWDENDDTTKDYTPLVELDSISDNDDPLLTKPPSVHWSLKPLDDMTNTDWRDLKDEFNIISKGTHINPIRTWDESHVNQRIIDGLYSLGFPTPTPIQRAAIPIAIKEKDIIGIAETGSGKTIAYIIPLLNYILSIDDNYLQYEHLQESNLNKPLGLILAPTRELANQISSELSKFCEQLQLTSISIIGGHNYEKTINSLTNGIHIVVATPGRLIDCLERGIINLSNCYYMIFDEADRMIDMGFEKSLNSIYQYLPNDLDQSSKTTFNITKKITLMFTATFSNSIESLTKKYLNDPARLVIGQVGEKVDTINQQFELLSSSKDLDNKVNKLIKVITSHISTNPRHYSIIIFANYIKVVEDISTDLSNKGFDNLTIHGSKSQQARERSIDEFSKGNKRILIATDVAARGIDIANVSLVVNYQMSNKFDDYIHRIGRTGRAGNKGNSYTFLEDADKELFNDLRKFLRRNVPKWLEKYDNGVIRD